MADDSIRVTQTNSAEENHGRLFGVEIGRVYPVILCLVLGIIGFAWIQMRGGTDFASSVWILILPAALCALVTGFLFQGGKHPSFARDVAETLFTGGHAMPYYAKPTCAGPGIIPDGYLVQDLIVYHGLCPGGLVSKGFWIEVPDISGASDGQRNSFNETLSRIPALFPESVRLSIEFGKDSHFQDVLLRYKEQTETCEIAASVRCRNLTFLQFWQLMKQGDLRRHRVAIFLSQRVLSTQSAPWKFTQAQSHYENILAQIQNDFAEFGRALNQLLTSAGAAAVPMTDADHFRCFLEKLSPATALSERPDAFDDLDLTRPISENCFHGEIKTQGARGFWLDEMFHGVLVLKKWPTQTYPGVCSWLTHLPFGDYSITTRICRRPVSKLIAELQKELDRLNQILSAKPDEHQHATKQQLETRIQRLVKGDQIPLQMEYILVLRARTPEQLSDRMLAAKNAVQHMSGALIHEAVLPASSKNWFLQTLPGYAWNSFQGYSLYAESLFAADLFPISASFIGHLNAAEAIYSGAHGSLVGIKTFAGDGVHAMPQNMLIFGAPGMGKSVVLSNLLLQTAGFYSYTVIFDEGGSQMQVARELEGTPIVLKVGGTHSVNFLDYGPLPRNPFHDSLIVALVCQMIGVPSDPDLANYRSALVAKQLAQLCREFAQDQLSAMSETERLNLTRRAMQIQAVAQSQGIAFLDAFVEARDAGTLTGDQLELFPDSAVWEFAQQHADLVEDLVFSTLPPDRQLRLSSLKEHLELNANGTEGASCLQIATLLEPFTGTGRYASIFDRPTTIDLHARVLHIELAEIAHIDELIKRLFRTAVLTLVRRQLFTLPKLSRKRIIIEELSRFLELGGDTIVRELFEQMRKYRVQVTGVLQQWTRISDPSLRAALIGCTPAFLIFNTGDRKDLERLGADIGLSPTAQERILRYARPSQLTGRMFSEFCYYHIDPYRPICGTVRYFQPTENQQPKGTDSHA